MPDDAERLLSVGGVVAILTARQSTLLSDVRV
jgi:hypothetical protein